MRKYSAKMDCLPPECGLSTELNPLLLCCALYMKMTWVWEQGVQVDVLTTIILNDPLGESVLLIPEIQSSTRGPGHQREQILPVRPNNSHVAL